MAYIYHPMHMHIHTCYQPGGSMEAHMYNAHTLGMHYIHFTDHDTRTGPKQYPCNRFDFSKNALTYADYPGRSCGWKDIIGDPDITFEEAAMILHSSSQGEEYTPAGCSFFSSEKRHTVSLLADVTLTMGLDFELMGDARLVLDIRMSKRPPMHKRAHLRYVFGALSDNPMPLTAEIPLSKSENSVYQLHLSADVLKEDICNIVGGLDNVFDTVSVLMETKNGGSVTCKLNQFEIEAKYGFNDAVVRQRELAEQIGKRYHIKPFVTTEISGAGDDKNCFSTAVPVIDYSAHNYDITHEEAIAHVQKYGGIFSYNHPFEKYKRTSIKKEDIPFIIQRDADSFVASKAWGATLIEIGFVCGRCGFSLRDHLRFWDLISMGGVFLTGYGDSDSHHSDENWFDGNNFAAWIAADSKEVFPVSEESFIQSMKAGRLYSGDPVFLKNPINFTCGDLPMGAVIPIADYDQEARIMTFTADSPEKDWTVQVVIDGQITDIKQVAELLDEQGNLHFDFAVYPNLPVSFARVEMFNTDGRCVMLTNPIYLVKTAEFAGEIPPERLYASKKGEWGMNLNTRQLPNHIRQFNRPIVLHIGDTNSWMYPFFNMLIEEIKPDIIIHTGDLADEVKVGRMPETRNEYLSKIKVMLDMLERSEARIIITPGNNDLPDEIQKLCPKAEIYPTNTVLTLHGTQCRVGHQVFLMDFDKDWSFYGHGFTGETWRLEDNVKGIPHRFNACWGAVVCNLKDDKYVHIPVPGNES